MRIKPFIFSFLLIPFFLIAKPHGHECVNGNVQFVHSSKSHLQITASDKAIINWKDFSIESGECIQFIQPQALSAVLNRVTTDNPSKLFGTLDANGIVYLINPNGIIVGKEGVINTQSFIGSTFDVLDNDFIQNNALQFKGDSKSSITNLGTINAWDGDVILIGRHIENVGFLNAPNGSVELAAVVFGKDVLLKPSGKERVFIAPQSEYETKDEKAGIYNSGHISALKTRLLADGNPYALAINHEGVIDALDVSQRGGEVYLVSEDGRIGVEGKISATSQSGIGGTVHVLGNEIALIGSASIDVSGNLGGGEVLFGGDFQGKNPEILNATYTFVDKDARIYAKGMEQGDGGRVIIWSDEITNCLGIVDVTQGKQDGIGGFVEISGKTLGFTGDVLGAKTLLFDPADITVRANGGANVNMNTGVTPWIVTPGFSVGTLDNGFLSGKLDGGTDVTISTSGAGGTGNLRIERDVIWKEKTTLTLLVDNDLWMDHYVQCQGDNGGNVIVNVKRDLIMDSNGESPAVISSKTGNVTVTTGRHVVMLGSGGASGHAQIGHDTGDKVTSNIDITIGGDLNMVSGMKGANGYAQIGHSPLPGTSSSLTGNITINSIGGIIDLAPTDKDGAYCQIGHTTTRSTDTTVINGNVNVLNVGDTIKIRGGTATEGAYCLIGHGGMTNDFKDDMTGDIVVQSKGTISIVGGSEAKPQKFCGIGFAQELIGSKANIIKSNRVSVTTDGDIVIDAGWSNHGFIGADVGNSSNNVTCNIGLVEVIAGGGVTLRGNSQDSSVSQAVIGIVGESIPAQCGINIVANKDVTLRGGTPKGGDSPARIINGWKPPAGSGFVTCTVNNGDVRLIGGFDKGQANIVSHGPCNINVPNGNLLLTSNDQASIQTYAATNITVGLDVILTGDGGADAAFILSNDAPLQVTAGRDVQLVNNSFIRSFNRPLTVQANRNLDVSNDSFLRNSGGLLEAIAGVNINLNDQAFIENQTGNNINLVVDNLFPTAPGIGPGAFVLSPNATVTTTGQVRIFTARQSQNNIQGLVNGGAFVPGPLYKDIAPEKWGVYYSSSFFHSGSPFTIFYKYGLLSPQVVGQTFINIDEIFTYLHPYNEYLGWFMQFQAGYDLAAYEKENPEGLSSFEVIPEQLFYLRMQKNFDQNSRINHIISFPKSLREATPKKTETETTSL